MPAARRSSTSVQISRADLRVEADGRLVEQDELRIVEQPAGDEQPPAHAARELVDGVVAAIEQARKPERTIDGRGDVADAVEAREHLQVLLDGDVDVEVVELRDDAHLGPGLLGPLRQLVIEHPEHALVGDRLAGQQPHRGRLAGAVGPEQAEADARVDVQIQPVDRPDLPERLHDTLQLDRCHRSGTLDSVDSGTTPADNRESAGAA